MIVINRGSIVADGTPDSLAHSLSNENRLLLRLEGEEEPIKYALQAMNGVKRCSPTEKKEPGVFAFSVESEEGIDLRRSVFALAARNDWPILSMKNTDLTLEDVFPAPYQRPLRRSRVGAFPLRFSMKEGGVMGAIYKKELRSYVTSQSVMWWRQYCLRCTAFIIIRMLSGSTYYISTFVYSNMFIWSMMLFADFDHAGIQRRAEEPNRSGPFDGSGGVGLDCCG